MKGGHMKQKSDFEALLEKHRIAVERYINFRLINRFDADDVIGETYYAAYVGYETLRDKALFKQWILSIAKNQCNLWLRKKYGSNLVPLDSVPDLPDTEATENYGVLSILNQLPKDYSDLLLLTMQGYRQSEISARLSIPIGTVKSRLYYAKKRFRSMCTPDQLYIFEKGRKAMQRKDHTHGFPSEMPALSIQKSSAPFFNVKCEEQWFIIPRIGNECAEATYRYPDKKLVIVSNCYVPKSCQVHDVHGVKICRDTYLVRHKKLNRNEKIWFTQLTDEYIRNLGTIFDDEGCEEPTQVTTFLEESYDVLVNGNDRVHGIPVLIQENAAEETENGYIIKEENLRYTLGVWNVTVGNRSFETIKCIMLWYDSCEETYINKNGRVVLLRQYEWIGSIESNDYYSSSDKAAIKENALILINGDKYVHTEDRISQYVL